MGGDSGDNGGDEAGEIGDLFVSEFGFPLAKVRGLPTRLANDWTF
jgi:hypothetical protein